MREFELIVDVMYYSCKSGIRTCACVCVLVGATVRVRDKVTQKTSFLIKTKFSNMIALCG